MVTERSQSTIDNIVVHWKCIFICYSVSDTIYRSKNCKFLSSN